VGLLGLVLMASPLGPALEENFGLDWLFQLRGERPAPPEVVVVTLDKASADHFGLPNEPRKWPRALHAQLVENLARAGAAVIGFDIIFDEPRLAAHDARFAAAVSQAGNVVLFESLKKATLSIAAAAGSAAAEVTTERLIPPLPPFARAAAATAPFPLPKVPVKVSQFWLFKAGAGDRATLPVVMFQLYALPVYGELRQALAELSPAAAAALPASGEEVVRGRRVHEVIQHLRNLLRADHDLGPRLEALLTARVPVADARGRLLASLIHLYQDRDSRYLNFYGRPRRITTLPYHLVWQADGRAGRAGLPIDLRGKAVFVGFAERLQPEQKDGFYTVFSQEASGLDISGVEIAATAFANLIEDRPVRPLAVRTQLLLVAAWGVLLGMLCLRWRAPWAISVSLGLGLAYFGLAYYRFAIAAEWYPLVIPLFVQAPVALFAGVLWNYREARREREHIRRAFSHYLPPQVVDELATNLTHVGAGGREVYGACLATDAGEYTALAEATAPAALAALMNRYYEAMFRPVREQGGLVSDVIGDAMLAIWAEARSDAGLRERACHAALGVAQAVDQFNQSRGGPGLITRLGLHAGPMLLGHIGALDHYEYRAVGDIVNTATRIQALNKVLGTRILASHEAVADLPGLVTRELGTFLLPGKTRGVAICELMGARDQAGAAEQQQRGERFACALREYRQRRWREAHAGFEQLLAADPSDGPAHFYIKLCARFMAEPPGETWDGTVRVEGK
jgi:adenylate cyclase